MKIEIKKNDITEDQKFEKVVTGAYLKTRYVPLGTYTQVTPDPEILAEFLSDENLTFINIEYKLLPTRQINGVDIYVYTEDLDLGEPVTLILFDFNDRELAELDLGYCDYEQLLTALADADTIKKIEVR
jgi:hypothetical protein